MKPTNEQVFASVSFICKLFFHLGKICKRNEEVGSQVYRSREWTLGATAMIIVLCVGG